MRAFLLASVTMGGALFVNGKASYISFHDKTSNAETQFSQEQNENDGKKLE